MAQDHQQQDLESLLLQAPTVREHLDDFALRASHRLGADTEVSIALRHRGYDRLAASSSQRAAECDLVEEDEQAGPCVTAMDSLQMVLVPDIGAETRWPSWRRAATERGFRAAAGIPAHVTDGAEIALNLYSERVDPWDSATLVRADIFAQDVARTVRLCLQIARLTEASHDARQALDARSAIDRAVAVTMTESRHSASDALEALRDESLDRGADPSDIAAEVLRRSGADPGAPGAASEPSHDADR